MILLITFHLRFVNTSIPDISGLIAIGIFFFYLILHSFRFILSSKLVVFCHPTNNNAHKLHIPFKLPGQTLVKKKRPVIKHYILVLIYVVFVNNETKHKTTIVINIIKTLLYVFIFSVPIVV